MNGTLKKPKSKVPGSSSFATLGNAVQDGLIVAKLQFFSSTATIMMPYLQTFQKNASLVPFMTIEVTVLLEILMQKFIKQSELQAANNPVKIAKLNVLETGIHLVTADIDVGFAATGMSYRKRYVTHTEAIPQSLLGQTHYIRSLSNNITSSISW